MAVFVSYSSRDRALLAGLLAGLKRAHEQVWFDEDLSGGEAWWREILAQIRDCELFIVALSDNWVDSKACRAELQYAQALGKPMLPVQIGPLESSESHAFSQTPVIDYRNPSMDVGVRLVTSVHAQRAKVQPLPDPLPPEPPIPFAYLMRLAADVSAPTLTAQEQSSLVTQLKAGLDEDGGDASARADIAHLFRQLADRSDVTYRTRTEVDSVLEAIQTLDAQEEVAKQAADQAAEHAAPQAGYQWEQAYQPPADEPPRASQFPPPQPPGSNRTWLLVGGGVALAIIVAVVVVVFIVTRGPSDRPTLTASALPSVLLGQDDINQIMGRPDLTATEVFDYMAERQNAEDACSWLDGTASRDLYDGSGFTGVVDQAFVGADEWQPWVAQTVVTFTSVDQATAFVNGVEPRMKNCRGKTYTMSSDTETTNWTPGDVTRNGSLLTQRSTKEGGKGYSCLHVLRPVSNTVIETNACADDVGDQAVQVASKIAAKIDAELKK